MVLQTGIIVFLAFWVYQEYLYNQYLQDYVSSFLQGGGLLVIILGTVGILALVGLGLYLKLIRGRRGSDGSKKVRGATNQTVGSKRILDPNVEQNIAETMRRTPAQASSDTPRPLRSREESQASSGEPE